MMKNKSYNTNWGLLEYNRNFKKSDLWLHNEFITKNNGKILT